MPLVDMHDMLNHAHRNGYAVGCFNPVGLDFIGAIVQAAENCRSPVILGLAETHFEHDGFGLAAAAAEKAAQRAAVPVAVHLDRGASHEFAVRAINSGCNGVMVDASREPFPVNVAQTRRVVETAHACGVAVEGGLGYAGPEDGDGGKHPGEVLPVSVEEARAYVERTRVDCLALSVGTGHGRPHGGRSKLDGERLRRIHDAVKIPLAVRGDTGLPEEQYRRLVSYGVAKVNYRTVLSDAAAEAVHARARADGGTGYFGWLRAVRERIGAEVERCQRILGAAGRAAEVIARCRPWRPVQHVIVYNADGVRDSEVEAVMARGREMLSNIPGVRRVVAGKAVTEKPKYRFCWLVEFAHERVIAAYRDHPEHVAFADGFFRPIAADRLSLDFAGAGEGTETGQTGRVEPARA